MKILYVIHQYFPDNRGGTEQVLLHLLTEMQRQGHEVIVCAYSHDQNIQYDQETADNYYRYTEYQGVPLVEFSPKPSVFARGAVWGEFPCLELARLILKKERPDRVHLMHTLNVGQFADAAYELGIPYLCTVTDFWPFCPRINLVKPTINVCFGSEGGQACAGCGYDPQQCAEQQKLSARRLKNAVATVVPSKFVGEFLKKELGVEHFQVIPHGVDRKNLKLLPYPTLPKEQGELFRFSICAFHTPTKGLHLALDAFAYLKDIPNIRLQVYGGLVGSYGREMHLLGESDPRVCFKGPYTHDQLPDIFSQTDILLVPSPCMETYQLVMREAAICGVPCIATRAGAMKEFIQDGQNGLTFELGNALDLAVKMYLCMVNPSEILAMRKNLKDEIIPTIQEEADRYLSLYQQI